MLSAVVHPGAGAAAAGGGSPGHPEGVQPGHVGEVLPFLPEGGQPEHAGGAVSCPEPAGVESPGQQGGEEGALAVLLEGVWEGSPRGVLAAHGEGASSAGPAGEVSSPGRAVGGSHGLFPLPDCCSPRCPHPPHYSPPPHHPPPPPAPLPGPQFLPERTPSLSPSASRSRCLPQATRHARRRPAEHCHRPTLQSRSLWGGHTEAVSETVGTVPEPPGTAQRRF